MAPAGVGGRAMPRRLEVSIALPTAVLASVHIEPDRRWPHQSATRFRASRQSLPRSVGEDLATITQTPLEVPSGQCFYWNLRAATETPSKQEEILRTAMHRTVVAAAGATLLAGTVGAGPAEAKGKDVIVQNSRGMAKFDHRSDKVVAWDKKPDGRWIEAEIMWNLGGKPGTEGFSVYAKGAGTLKTKRARIPEGRAVAIRMCVWKPGRTDCSAWHYGRA